MLILVMGGRAFWGRGRGRWEKVGGREEREGEEKVPAARKE